MRTVAEQAQREADVRFATARPECFERLSERERRIFIALHSECAYQRQSAAALSKLYGVARERIVQIETVAFLKIRLFREQDPRKCVHCGGQGWV